MMIMTHKKTEKSDGYAPVIDQEHYWMLWVRACDLDNNFNFMFVAMENKDTGKYIMRGRMRAYPSQNKTVFDCDLPEAQTRLECIALASEKANETMAEVVKLGEAVTKDQEYIFPEYKTDEEWMKYMKESDLFDFTYVKNDEAK